MNMLTGRPNIVIEEPPHQIRRTPKSAEGGRISD